MACTFRAHYVSQTNEIALVHEGPAGGGFGATSVGSTVSVMQGTTSIPVSYAEVWRWSTYLIFLKTSQPLAPGTYDVSLSISASGHPPNGCSSTGSFDVLSGAASVDPLQVAVIVPSPAFLGEPATIWCAFPKFKFDPALHKIELQDSMGMKVPDPTQQVWHDNSIDLRMPTKQAYSSHTAAKSGHLIQFGTNTDHRLAFNLVEFPVQPPPLPALKGTFRVTISGFKAVTETFDSGIGPHGDEVIAYVRSVSMDLSSADSQVVNYASHPVIWWIHTSHEKGAKTLEDIDPSSDPDWPVIAWEGELESGRNGVVVCPFLFEQDTGNADDLDVPDFTTALVAGGLPALTTKANEIRSLLNLPSLPSAITNPLSAAATLDGVQRVLTEASAGQLDINWTATSGHRPIGAVDVGGTVWPHPGKRRMRPFIIVLTYELAKLLTQTPALQDTITLPYTDTVDGSGSYEMYLQVKEV